MTEAPKNDRPPDRLAAHPTSPFYDGDTLERGIGVRFKGAERTDVDEYCVSESWIRVALGKKVDRRGAALTIKLSGPVEVWFRDRGENDGAGTSGSDDTDERTVSVDGPQASPIE